MINVYVTVVKSTQWFICYKIFFQWTQCFVSTICNQYQHSSGTMQLIFFKGTRLKIRFPSTSHIKRW